MADGDLLPLDTKLDLQSLPAPEYMPLQYRILAVTFLALTTALFSALWYTAVKHRHSPTGGYAWSTAIMALITIFAAFMAFWRFS